VHVFFASVMATQTDIRRRASTLQVVLKVLALTMVLFVCFSVAGGVVAQPDVLQTAPPAGAAAALRVGRDDVAAERRRRTWHASVSVNDRVSTERFWQPSRGGVPVGPRVRTRRWLRRRRQSPSGRGPRRSCSFFRDALMRIG